MIIRQVIDILGQTIYRNYSDKGVYIRNKTTGLLFTDVNSSIDYEYEETDIEDEIAPWKPYDGTASTVYQIGDKVTHNGKTWECTIANNVWEPGVYGWIEI